VEYGLLVSPKTLAEPVPPDAKLKNLKKIYLKGTQFTNEGKAELRRRLPNFSID
jgi:hypothetical protein